MHMSEQLSEANQQIVDRLLSGQTEGVQTQALLAIRQLLPENRRELANFLIEHLKSEEDSARRGWCLSALVEANTKKAGLIAGKHLDSTLEQSEIVRYWAAIALARSKPDQYQQRLVEASRDPSELVRTVSLRLLLDDAPDKEKYAEELLTLARTPRNLRDRWAVFKALRCRLGSSALPDWAEGRFLPILEERLLDHNEVQIVQREAALALGDMDRKHLEAISVLKKALELNRADLVRRACVEALVKIGRPAVKEALIIALHDRDAEIRIRAAIALKNILGAPEAVRYIVEEHLLAEGRISTEYIDALRQIDGHLAANLLTVYMQKPDPKVSAQAMQALALLGNEEAARAVRQQRTHVIEEYTQMMTVVDAHMANYVSEVLKQAGRATGQAIEVQKNLLIVAVVASVLGTVIALLFAGSSQDNGRSNIGLGLAIVAAFLAMILFLKNPLGPIRRTTSILVQMNAVFLGYLRQMSQTDAVFKQQYLTSTEMTMAQAKQTIDQIQESMEHTLETVRENLDMD
jgi:HEAT repeat protein